jgi:hypothetical protein
MDLPPRQLLHALSSDEPMRCMGRADPQGVASPPAYRFQKQHRQAFRSTKGVTGRLALRRMWVSIVDSGEDQCVRSELLKTWLYLFHQDDNAECVPPALAADAAPALAEDSMVSALAVDAGVIDVDNPLDAYSRAQTHLFGNQWRNLTHETARQGPSSGEQDYNRDGHRHKSKSKGHNHNPQHFSKKKPMQKLQQNRQHKPTERPVVGEPSVAIGPSSQTLRLSLSTSSLKAAAPNGEQKLSIKRKVSLIIKE